MVQKLLRKAHKGMRGICIPGNHDEFARDYANMLFGGISAVTDAIHTTADGRRLLAGGAPPDETGPPAALRPVTSDEGGHQNFMRM